jgi:phosphohistidine phosphatase
VGHQPDLASWAEQLTWGDDRQRLLLKKAGIIGLLIPDEGNPLGKSTLFWLTSPRLFL